MEDREKRDCVRELMNGFTTYDQNVDIVSCWQSYFSHALKEELTYFDRYPVMGDRRLTPDFTTLFGEDYGIIGEIKRAFPSDDVAFKREMDQLMKYDDRLPFKAGADGSTIVPAVHDIMLVTTMMASSQVSGRIQGLLDDSSSGVSFERNLVIIEFVYNAGDRVSRYVFKKPLQENRPFADENLPHEKRLETIMVQRRETIQMQPKHFLDYKIRQVFCNDPPPPLYTATYLWTRVFYDFLSSNQRELWRRGNAQKILPIEVDIHELKRLINKDYIPEGRIRVSWLKETLDFLIRAGLAQERSLTEYVVDFRNLRSLVGRRRFGDLSEEELEDLKGYGGLLANLFCDPLASAKMKPTRAVPSRKQIQRTFHETFKDEH